MAGPGNRTVSAHFRSVLITTSLINCPAVAEAEAGVVAGGRRWRRNRSSADDVATCASTRPMRGGYSVC